MDKMLPGGSMKRPKPEKDEDEDDLFALQEQFLREKQTASATVVKCHNNTDQDSNHDGQEKRQHPSSFTAEMYEDQEPEAKIADNHDIPKSVFDLTVVERDISQWKSNEWMKPSLKVSSTENGFPKVTKYKAINSDAGNKDTDTKRSLFAKQFNIRPKKNGE